MAGLAACEGENFVPSPVTDAGNSADFDARPVVPVDPPPVRPTCTSTCTERYARRCVTDTEVEICDDYRGDGCLTWGDVRPCRLGWTCVEGVCEDPNQPPQPPVLRFETDEDTPLELTLSAEDPDGDELFFQLTGRPGLGALQGVPPRLTYTPRQDLNGEDRFTFTVTDRRSPPVEGEAIITIRPVNDLATLQDVTVQLSEDVAVTFLLPAEDPDADLLAWRFDPAPGLGTIEGEGPAFVFTPRADVYGEETIRWTVFDGTEEAEPAALTFRISPVNDRPVGISRTLTLEEDTLVDFVLEGEDVDGDPLTYSIRLFPRFGELTGSGATWRYTPRADFFGEDSLSFLVDDGRLTSALATVTFVVTPVPDAPVAEDLAVRTPEDTPVVITLQGTDADFDPLTFAILDPPTLGRLEGEGRTLTYRPDRDVFGEDRFTYQVSDGTLLSNIAEVVVTIDPVNDPPVVEDLVVALAQDEGWSGTLVAFDVENDPLTWLLVSPPTVGTLDFSSPPTVSWTPPPGFFGTEQFTFRVNDGQANSNLGRVTFQVSPRGEPPVIGRTAFSLNEDTVLPLNFEVSDPDTPLTSLRWTLVRPPNQGVLRGTLPNVSYEPVLNFNGQDSFVVRVSDGVFSTPDTTITLTVLPVNDAPTADDLEYTFDEDTSQLVTFRGFDPDGDPISFVITTPPLVGSLTGSGSTRTFTPPPNAFGTFRFTYQATDGQLLSNVAVVTLNVRSVNDLPVIDRTPLATDEDIPLPVRLRASDVETAESDLVWTLLDPPDNLEISGTLPDITLTPDPDWNGTDSLRVRVEDADGGQDEATIAITVRPVNDPPTVASLFLETDEDVPVAVRFEAFDVDGDPLTFVPLTPLTLGQLAGDVFGATGRYVPDDDVWGREALRFVVSDGLLQSEPADFEVLIRAVADAPTADNISLRTDEDIPLAFQLSGDDADGDPITFQLVDPLVDNATVTLETDGSGLLIPDPDWNGVLTFRFVTFDGALTSLPATVTVVVDPVNDAPVVVSRGFTIQEDDFFDHAPVAFDVDGDPITLRLGTAPTLGVLSGPLGGFRYTGLPNVFGADTFTILASDGVLDSEPGVFDVDILPVNDPPVLAVPDLTVAVGGIVDTAVTVFDVEGTPTRLLLVAPLPTRGTVALGELAFLYTETDGSAGVDAVTLVAKETEAGASTFACDDGGTIPADWECDGMDDCADGSDESCADPLTCVRDGDDECILLNAAILSAPATATITIVNRPPLVAAPLARSWLGNTPLPLPAGTLTESVGNPGDVVSVLNPGTVPAATGHGTCTSFADGRLTYVPASGERGASTCVVTLATQFGQRVNRTVNLTMDRMHWYVIQGNGSGGVGTLDDPFRSLASAGTAALAGDRVVVRGNVTGSLMLPAAVDLTSDEAGFFLPAGTGTVSLVPPAGARPTWSGVSAGPPLTLQQNNTVSRLQFVRGSAPAGALVVSADGQLTMESVALASTATPLVQVNNGIGSVVLSEVALTYTDPSASGAGGPLVSITPRTTAAPAIIPTFDLLLDQVTFRSPAGGGTGLSLLAGTGRVDAAVQVRNSAFGDPADTGNGLGGIRVAGSAGSLLTVDVVDTTFRGLSTAGALQVIGTPTTSIDVHVAADAATCDITDWRGNALRVTHSGAPDPGVTSRVLVDGCTFTTTRTPAPLALLSPDLRDVEMRDVTVSGAQARALSMTANGHNARLLLQNVTSTGGGNNIVELLVAGGTTQVVRAALRNLDLRTPGTTFLLSTIGPTEGTVDLEIRNSTLVAVGPAGPNVGQVSLAMPGRSTSSTGCHAIRDSTLQFFNTSGSNSGTFRVEAAVLPSNPRLALTSQNNIINNLEEPFVFYSGVVSDNTCTRLPTTLQP
jgi:hypothetical protein